MWSRPWGIAEGIAIVCGLICVGLAAQFSVGSVVWEHLSWPMNGVMLVAYLLVLLLAYLLRRRIYLVRWAMTFKAAVPALVAVVALTLVMGLTTQDSASSNPLRHMLTFWPMVMAYVWMATILGLVSIRGICTFRLRRLPSLLLHTGLFVAMVCATLGSADMRRMNMNAQTGQAEWRVTDADGRMHELPLAIELQDFSIDEYPPKLMMVDNATGHILPEGRAEQLSLDSIGTVGTLCGWNIHVSQLLEYAASSATEDTIRYVDWRTVGATNAAYIEVDRAADGQHHEGWVSCGSFVFPYQALRLDTIMSVIMPDREPRRFTSQVRIYAESGQVMDTLIEVNRPVRLAGWTIYQVSYDQTKGRWSDIAVFELITDPWLPAVYVGIFLMLAGAVGMFVMSGGWTRSAPSGPASTSMSASLCPPDSPSASQHPSPSSVSSPSHPEKLSPPCPEEGTKS